MHDFKITRFTYGDLIRLNAVVSYGGMRISEINLYIIDGLLIDTGPSVMEKELQDFFLTTDIRQVVLTHIHEDHTGMAPWIEKNLKVPIYIHKNLIDEASKKAVLKEYRTQIWGERHGFSAIEMPATITTPNHRFRVIDTPGHHAYHCALLEENLGWLFSGDLFIESRQDVAFESENVPVAIHTIENLLKENFTTVFCYHAGMVENGKERFMEKLSFFKDLHASVTALKQQGMSLKEIDNKLFPRKHIITAFSQGEWSSLNMVRTSAETDPASIQSQK